MPSFFRKSWDEFKCLILLVLYQNSLMDLKDRGIICQLRKKLGHKTDRSRQALHFLLTCFQIYFFYRKTTRLCRKRNTKYCHWQCHVYAISGGDSTCRTGVVHTTGSSMAKRRKVNQCNIWISFDEFWNYFCLSACSQV